MTTQYLAILGDFDAVFCAAVSFELWHTSPDLINLMAVFPVLARQEFYDVDQCF